MPRPSRVRPGAISATLAMALAVTAGCRVTGLETRGPSGMRRVCSAASVIPTYSSRYSDCESAMPSRSKPLASACCTHPVKTSGRSGKKVMPTCTLMPAPSSIGRTHALRAPAGAALPRRAAAGCGCDAPGAAV